MLSLAEWIAREQTRHASEGLSPLVSDTGVLASLAAFWEGHQRPLEGPESDEQDQSATPMAWIPRRPLQRP